MELLADGSCRIKAVGGSIQHTSDGLPMPSSPSPISAKTIRVLDPHGELRPWSEIEDEVFRHALAAHEGNVTKAASSLRIGRSTLFRWLTASADYDEVSPLA